MVIEPIMTVEVVAPAEFQGTVLGSLSKRQAVIIGQDSTEGYFSVVCEVCCIATVVACKRLLLNSGSCILENKAQLMMCFLVQ